MTALDTLFAIIAINFGDENRTEPTYYGSPAHCFYIDAKIAMTAVRNGKQKIAKHQLRKLIALTYAGGEMQFDDTTGTINGFLTELQSAAA